MFVVFCYFAVVYGGVSRLLVVGVVGVAVVDAVVVDFLLMMLLLLPQQFPLIWLTHHLEPSTVVAVIQRCLLAYGQQ